MQNRQKIIYAFIDSQNLYRGIQDQGWLVDYKKLYVYLLEKCHVQKVFVYIGYLETNVQFYTKLKSYGYEIVFKATKRYGRNRADIKGNVDVDLTVDAIRKKDQYELGIFVSADGDFLALYDYLVNECNKNLLIMIPNSHKYSSLLLKYRNKLRFMDDLRTKLERV